MFPNWGSVVDVGSGKTSLARIHRAVEAWDCVVETVAIAAHFFVFVDFRMKFVDFYSDPTNPSAMA
jgi:hypothetical protein